MNLIPNVDYILVKPIKKPGTTESGIIIQPENKQQEGEIFSIGGTDKTEYQIKDTVIFREWSSFPYKIDGEEYLLVNKKEIIAFMKH